MNVTALMVTAGTIWIVAVASMPAEKQGQLTTAERVAGAAWWPTKPGVSTAQYVGSATCARCHQRIADSQAGTAMARTAQRAADSDALRAHGVLSVKIGGHIHEIRTSNAASVYSVSDGKDTITNVLGWAFGAGKVGQTFLLERDGAMYEARASYFDGKRALDVTPGRALDRPLDLDAAIGRRLPLGEARRCFACHSTALTTRDGSVRDIVPGVTCEACHGPGRVHANAIDEDRVDEGRAAIANPATFNAVDAVDFCGACHGTYWDVTLAGDKGVKALRSQPFRLQSSRCWGEGDRRITCVACHDPHQPLEREPQSYDGRCLQCHRAVEGNSATGAHARSCSARQRERCSACHMPKYRVDEMHASFTDHLIRVVRKD
jgi:Cytochrome c554 and c-prime